MTETVSRPKIIEEVRRLWPDLNPTETIETARQLEEFYNGPSKRASGVWSPERRQKQSDRIKGLHKDGKLNTKRTQPAAVQEKPLKPQPELRKAFDVSALVFNGPLTPIIQESVSSPLKVGGLSPTPAKAQPNTSSGDSELNEARKVLRDAGYEIKTFGGELYMDGKPSSIGEIVREAKQLKPDRFVSR